VCLVCLASSVLSSVSCVGKQTNTQTRY
jgi:hypothetical protein